MYILHKAKNLLVYKGTITGLRVSAVDGTAFIDNAGATIPTYADGNHLIEIYDSANRMLKGVLKAAGTVQTYTDLLSGWDFTSGWSMHGNGTIDDTNSFTTSEIDGILKEKVFLTPLALYKRTFERSTTASTCISRVALNGTGNVSPLSGTAEMTTGTAYHTGSTTSQKWYIRNGGAGTTDVTSMKAEQVLTPSSAGATIVSAKAGETYNFAYKNASFTYNAASYYCIVRKIR